MQGNSTHGTIRSLLLWICITMQCLKGFPGGASVKESACQCMRHERCVPSLDWEDHLEEGRTTHSRISARRIQCTGNPGGLQSIGLHRIRHYWSDLGCMHSCTAMKTLYMLCRNWICWVKITWKEGLLYRKTAKLWSSALHINFWSFILFSLTQSFMSVYSFLKYCKTIYIFIKTKGWMKFKNCILLSK